MKIKLILFIIGIFFIGQTGAQNRKELEAQKKSVLTQIEKMNRLIEENSKIKQNTINKLRILQRRIEMRQQYIENLKKEIHFVDNRIDENQGIIRSLNKDLKKIKKEYAKLIYHAFTNRYHKEFIFYILASDDINTAFQRIKYYKAYTNFRKEQVKLIKAVEKTLINQILQLEKSKEEKLDLLADKEKEQITLSREKNEKREAVHQLKNKENQLRSNLEKQRRIAQKLEEEIRRYIEEEAKKRNMYDLLTPEEKLVSENFEKNIGRMPWPTQYGVITEEYGEHEHPVLKGTKVRNNGIDISTVENSEVRAIFGGKVSRVFSILGANNTVIVRHGNFLSVYQNLNKVFVKPGQDVSVKEPIGIVYTNPDDNSSVLHLEIWKEFEKQDPEIWLSNN
jgi:septal ring factor EnvC (AmiA/AmiB activator)